MPECTHPVLTLMPPPEARLCCRHCHLTITARELGQGCCPECLEVNGLRRCDFDEVAQAKNRMRYCCEACGLVVDV
jgi:hypothetical protein